MKDWEDKYANIEGRVKDWKDKYSEIESKYNNLTMYDEERKQELWEK